MEKESISFSKYGKNFQELLAFIILEDRPFCDQVEEVLNVKFFELKYLRVFVSKIFEYRKEYGSHPTSKIFDSITSRPPIDWQRLGQGLMMSLSLYRSKFESILHALRLGL